MRLLLITSYATLSCHELFQIILLNCIFIQPKFSCNTHLQLYYMVTSLVLIFLLLFFSLCDRGISMGIKSPESWAKLPGFRSRLYLLLAVWPWGSYLISLSSVSKQRLLWGLTELIHIKHLDSCQEHSNALQQLAYLIFNCAIKLWKRVCQRRTLFVNYILFY